MSFLGFKYLWILIHLTKSTLSSCQPNIYFPKLLIRNSATGFLCKAWINLNILCYFWACCLEHAIFLCLKISILNAHSNWKRDHPSYLTALLLWEKSEKMSLRVPGVLLGAQWHSAHLWELFFVFFWEKSQAVSLQPLPSLPWTNLLMAKPQTL